MSNSLLFDERKQDYAGNDEYRQEGIGQVGLVQSV